MPPGTASPSALRVYIVPHTHWDREWYQPLGRFRQRLVALIDELLDDPPQAGESFLLDGQAIVLDDYLAVRPERRAELSALLREGRLEAGPWYVLADELIPGGEALIRNLLAGRRALQAMRASAPPVLYCPDSFGHPAALPTLANGFGLPTVIAWRGYGGPRWPAGDAAWWAGADGSTALLLHLPPDGYEFGSNLPTDASDAAERWRRIRDVLGGRSRLGVVLVHNGADHHARQSGHREAAAALARAAFPDEASVSALGDFVREAVARADAAELPRVAGELRDSYGYTWTLQGTFATRAAQKRHNAMVERALVRDAEPFAALAHRRGARSQRALASFAWRTLLECHPHDTLCGCSVDQVARAADVRWEDARVQAEGIRTDAVFAAIAHDPARAHARRDEWHPAVIIRNRAPRSRSGVCRIRLETFLADVAVGPSSAGQPRVLPDLLEPPTGLAMPHQVLAVRTGNARIESPRHYPDNDLVVVREVLAWLGAVPAYGLRAFSIAEVRPGDAREAEATLPVPPARVNGSRLTNGLIDLDIAGLMDVECRRDRGDLYTPSVDEAASHAGVLADRTVHDGPLRASRACDWGVEPAGGGLPTYMTAVVSIDAGEPFVRITVRGDHRGENQRIRILVRTGIAGAAVWADAAFGPVRRTPLEVSAADAAREAPPPTAPLHRYVSLFGESAGATVYSDGLAEYEVLGDGTVAITLIRAVGELSRNDLAERPGHAGWPSPTPEAQSQGPFAAELALYLHGPSRDRATIDSIERIADDVLLPLEGDTLRSALHIPAPVAGAALDGEGLAFSAMKESEDGAWTVLRCVNLLDEAVDGSWTCGWPVSEARLARLDETPGAPVPVDGARVSFTAGARAVVTLLVR